MRISSVALLALITMNLLACNAAPDSRYLDSRVLPGLEIPPDLTASEVDSRFELPANISGDTNDGSKGGKIPVLAKVDGIRLEGREDFHWLVVEAPVANLYELVRDFWLSEGFALAMDEPVVGIMETEWVFKKEGDAKKGQSFFANLFGTGDLSDSQDQYRTRIARDNNAGISRVYVAHRGTEYEHKLDTRQSDLRDSKGVNQWKFRQSDSELEAEMLSRLMVYPGLEQSQVDKRLANIKLFTPRATLRTDYAEDETILLIQDSYTQAWNRVLHQLERMDLEVISANMRAGLSQKGIIQIKSNIDAKLEKTGFLSLFSSKTEIKKRQFSLIISEEAHNLTRVVLETSAGDIDNSAEAVELLTLLYNFIK